MQMAKLVLLLLLASLVVSSLLSITTGARDPFSLSDAIPKIKEFRVPRKFKEMEDDSLCLHEGEDCISPPEDDEDDRPHCDFQDGQSQNCICSAEYGEDIVTAKCITDYDN